MWRGWLEQGLEVWERRRGVAYGEPLIVTLEYILYEVMVRVIVEL